MKQAILDVEAAAHWRDVANIKKIKGSTNAFRIRVGDHRIGLFIEGNLAEFVRVHSRRDVYREFPCAQLFELRGAGEVQITGVFPRLPAGQADG